MYTFTYTTYREFFSLTYVILFHQCYYYDQGQGYTNFIRFENQTKSKDYPPFGTLSREPAFNDPVIISYLWPS